MADDLAWLPAAVDHEMRQRDGVACGRECATCWPSRHHELVCDGSGVPAAIVQQQPLPWLARLVLWFCVRAPWAPIIRWLSPRPTIHTWDKCERCGAVVGEACDPAGHAPRPHRRLTAGDAPRLIYVDPSITCACGGTMDWDQMVQEWECRECWRALTYEARATGVVPALLPYRRKRPVALPIPGPGVRRSG